jgi:hypothetical protein
MNTSMDLSERCAMGGMDWVVMLQGGGIRCIGGEMRCAMMNGSKVLLIATEARLLGGCVHGLKQEGDLATVRVQGRMVGAWAKMGTGLGEGMRSSNGLGSSTSASCSSTTACLVPRGSMSGSLADMMLGAVQQ